MNNKGGITLKTYYCKICKVKIGLGSGLYGNQLCQNCSQIERRKNNHYFCEDCGTRVSSKTTKKCQSCYGKWMLLNPEKTNRYNGGRPKCIDCSTEISYGWKNKQFLRCRKCWFIFRVGKNHPRYKDGTGREPYSSDFTPKLKLEIRERDEFKCKICNMTEEIHLKKYNRVLEVHHKDRNKHNCKESNLETRCKKCNIREI